MENCINNVELQLVFAEKYTMQLHNNSMPEKTTMSSLPHLTHNQQPYAFIENMITDDKYRNKGVATQCLDYAKRIVIKEKNIFIVTYSDLNHCFLPFIKMKSKHQKK